MAELVPVSLVESANEQWVINLDYVVRMQPTEKGTTILQVVNGGSTYAVEVHGTPAQVASRPRLTED
jgi:hypothetical protein